MNHKKIIIKIFVFLALVTGITFAFLNYRINKTGDSETESGNNQSVKRTDSTKNAFFTKSAIGLDFKDNPRISNVIASDLDGDNLLDVLVCDMQAHTISWIRQYPEDEFKEEILAKDIIAPAHIEVNDFDGDGDNDLIIAVLGMLFPNNDKIGSVIILENDGSLKFKKRVVAENVARVSDVRAGDLDGDGDQDLAVAMFGYDDGETRWMENLGNWKFKSHILQSMSGPLNIEITDIDNDSDLDIVSLVTQEWEEIHCFINDGKGNFQPKLIWGSNNKDFGSSGINLTDLNGDGKIDILYTNGDAFDYIPPMPRPWHGLQWLENKGNLTFEFHRICDFPGAFSPRSYDIDQDNDMDIFVVSGFNLWDKPEAQSFIWLENDGSNHFIKHTIDTFPSHIITMDLGDFNQDGNIDAVTGGMYVYPPFNQLMRVTLWQNNGKSTK
jgi:hypothetical protein